MYWTLTQEAYVHLNDVYLAYTMKIECTCECSEAGWAAARPLVLDGGEGS